MTGTIATSRKEIEDGYTYVTAAMYSFTFPELVTSQSNLTENRKRLLACTFDKFRERVDIALLNIFKVKLVTKQLNSRFPFDVAY